MSIKKNVHDLHDCFCDIPFSMFTVEGTELPLRNLGNVKWPVCACVCVCVCVCVCLKAI